MGIKKINEMIAEIAAHPATMSERSLKASSTMQWKVGVHTKLREWHKYPKNREQVGKLLRHSAKLTDVEKAKYKMGLELSKAPKKSRRKVAMQLGLSYHLLTCFVKGKHLEDLE